MKIVTHDGHFHADEAFGCAALLLLYPDAEIIRTRDEAIVASGDIVLDLGHIYDPEKNRFDHHQREGAGERINGIPYASFGLIWKHFGNKLVTSQKAWEKIDQKLVEPVDTLDTMIGGLDLIAPKDSRMHPYFIQDAIEAFNPTWKESNDTVDAKFMEAVAIAQKVLQREITRVENGLEAQGFIEKAYETIEDPAILVLDENYPFGGAMADHPETLFVVQPSKTKDKWRVMTIRDSDFSYTNRKDLPKAWGGKADRDLAQVTGVEDATFCHRSLFLAVTKSKEGAIALAKLAIGS